ncbi:MAG: helix-turn-helix domain-containing protein [Defluviitaleaceae bacterium]|nr:helix-turn-helix domain-containing protein [Defluviitaleaceae bacterium]
MKANSADIIKSLRKEMGISQEDMAERLFMSVRQLARIESGEAGMGVWQFVSALELLGAPSEDFWLLYLSSAEYASYREYRKLKRRLSDSDMPQSTGIIENIEHSVLFNQPVVRQFVLYAKILIDVNTKLSSGLEICADEILNELRFVMAISKPGFDENVIPEYRMSYNEIMIAMSMAQCYSLRKEFGRAADIVLAMIQGREDTKTSEEDRAILFPPLYSSLSHIYNAAGKYKEALKACENAVEIAREYNNLRSVPDILCCMAHCHLKLGEEEHIYRTHLVRAYHMCYAIGKNEAAARIKDDALKYYNVVLP